MIRQSERKSKEISQYGMQNLLQWLKKIALSLDMQTDFTELKKDVSYNQGKFDTAIFQVR